MKNFWLLLIVSLFVSSNSFSSATRILDGQAITNGANTLTLPTATDTLVGKATTDTFTNKTMDGGSNTFTAIGDGSLSVSYTKADGSRAFTGDQSMGTHKITNLGTPSASTDAATKAYVDAASPAPTITGTRASPSNITAAGGIAFTGTNYSNTWFIQGNAAPITVTANPQIAAGTNVGQRLNLVGRSATNTLTLADGTGLSLNGTWVGGLDSVLDLEWDGTNWLEIARR